MKIRPSIRNICEKCQLVPGGIIIICSNPRHRQKQG